MAGLCYQAAEIALRAYDMQDWGDQYLRDGRFIGITGSNDPLDWWSNLHIRKVAGLHHGFRSAAKHLCQKLGGVSRDTIFTGHSRGGAIAVILGQLYNRPVITFGAPISAELRPELCRYRRGPLPPLNLCPAPNSPLPRWEGGGLESFSGQNPLGHLDPSRH